MIIETLPQLILFILPAYFANAVPVVLGGGTPVDFGKKFFDGKRVFGKGKTLRGFVAGVAVGSLVGLAESYLLSWPDMAYIGFLLSVGTMCGDLLGSFLKRRMGMPQGHPSFLIDQMPFFILALAFASPFYLPTLDGIIILAVLTYFMHVTANFLANRAGLKKVPW